MNQAQKVNLDMMFGNTNKDVTKFNHSPFVHSVWVEYNGQRFKNPYMIRLKDGTEVEAIPNANAWAYEQNSWCDDSEVTHIKALPDGEGPRRSFTGGWRVARDISFMGKDYPVWCGSEYGFIRDTDLPKGKMIAPIEIMAYRKRTQDERKTHVFATKGLVLDIHEYSSWADMKAIEAYVNHPLFWLDENTEVMSHAECVHSINRLAKYNYRVDTVPDLVGQFCGEFMKAGVEVKDYFGQFDMYFNKFVTDTKDFVRQINSDTFQKVYATPADTRTAAFQKTHNFLNALRGPKDPVLGVLGLLDFQYFMSNPIKPQSGYEFTKKVE